jgi:hypothetical protein
MAKDQRREGGQFRPIEVVISVTSELALDSPKRARARLGYEVNALVNNGEVDCFSDRLGHLVQKPDILKLCAILGSRLEIQLGQALERCATVARVRKTGNSGKELVPAAGTRDQLINLLMSVLSLHSASRSVQHHGLGSGGLRWWT